MTEITRLELELSDAQLHLENAKTYIQLMGVNYGTLALYFEARDRVSRISQNLNEAKKNQWKWAGFTLLFSRLKHAKKWQNYWKKWQNMVK